MFSQRHKDDGVGHRSSLTWRPRAVEFRARAVPCGPAVGQLCSARPAALSDLPTHGTRCLPSLLRHVCSQGGSVPRPTCGARSGARVHKTHAVHRRAGHRAPPTARVHVRVTRPGAAPTPRLLGLASALCPRQTHCDTGARNDTGSSGRPRQGGNGRAGRSPESGGRMDLGRRLSRDTAAGHCIKWDTETS